MTIGRWQAGMKRGHEPKRNGMDEVKRASE